MPIEQINFRGINRAITDYGNTGACEEMINIRPTDTGLIPVRPFTAAMSNINYDKVYTHKASAETNYIALRDESNTVKIYHISDSGSVIQNGGDASHPEIDSFSISGATHFSFDQLHFAYVGNIMLFSVCDKEDGLLLDKAYLWDGANYVPQETNAPQIEASLTISDLTEKHFEGEELNMENTTPHEFAEKMSIALSGIAESNENLCFGTIIVAIAFKTKDGKTFWTNRWLAKNPEPFFEGSDLYHGASETQSLQPYGAYIAYSGGNIYVYDSATDEYVAQPETSHFYSACGAKISLNIQPIPSGSWDKDASIITSVEVYASKPVFYIDASKEESLHRMSNVFYHGDLPSNQYLGSHFILPPIQVSDMDLDSQLLYHQESINIEELVGRTGAYVLPLKFGGKIQTTGKTLEVDAGPVTRYGDILAYNARFHFFDSVSKTEAGMPQFDYEDSSATLYQTDVIAVYNDGQRDVPIYCGVAELQDIDNNLPTLIIAPSLRIKEVVIQQPAGDILGTTRRIPMTPSARYNYSICIDSSHSSGYRIPLYDVTQLDTELIIDEPDTINVTEQYNAFVFNVNNSYLAPGKVLDIQPQMVAVKDVTFGDYPLNVFTNRGLYALLQGSGTVLYGAFRPLSNLISSANSVSTEQGTFFIASGGLWLIAGTSAVLVSDALSRGPHKYIRSCEGHEAILANYISETLLSQVPFDRYVGGARMAYNRYRDEIIISNPDYGYSYVLSLKYRQWFKITMQMEQDVVGSDIARTPGTQASRFNVVRFSEETDAPTAAHLQSRPFSIGFQYTHIHRVVEMVRACLGSTDKMILALYGSDDLQTWKLLCYADRKGSADGHEEMPLRISQIRTPAAARSWRYYTVTLGGIVPADTDISVCLAEYIPVIRRIG